MIDQLKWNTSDLGILTGTLFWAYGIGQAINGRLSEIVGPTKFIIASVVLSALVNILFSFQTSIGMMAFICGLNGYFQSMAWAPGMAIIARWWPSKTHGFATGFAHAFSGFGQCLSMLAVMLAFKVFPAYGWQAAFVVSAIFSITALAIYLVFAYPTPSLAGLTEYFESSKMRSSEGRTHIIASRRKGLYPYWYLLSNKQFIVWMIIAFITGFVRYGLMTWIPFYFVNHFGFNIMSGLAGALSLPIGMGIGTLVVPWMTDKWCSNDRLPAIVISSILGALAIGCFLLFDMSAKWQIICAQALLFFAGFFIYAINGTVWAYATDIGGRVFSATSSGILNFSAYMGAAMQSFFYGFFLDKNSHVFIFVSMISLCCLMALMSIIGKRTIKPYQLKKDK